MAFFNKKLPDKNKNEKFKDLTEDENELTEDDLENVANIPNEREWEEMQRIKKEQLKKQENQLKR